jgi:inhibitor of KinA
MEWIPYGPHAVLIRFATRVGEEAFERSRALVSELERHPPQGMLDYVPAFTTLLLEFDPLEVSDVRTVAPGLVGRLEKAAGKPPKLGAVKEFPVVYDGPDLERVAQAHNLTVAEVRALHSAPVYKVYMLGFSPGFPYLGDLDSRLHTPRLATPRKRVPAGSVAIGGEHTGIYPVEGPGGWNLIGRVTVPLLDLSRLARRVLEESAFLLKPGDQVKFMDAEAGAGS